MRLKPGTAGRRPPPLDAGRQVGLQALIISILLRRVDGFYSPSYCIDDIARCFTWVMIYGAELRLSDTNVS